MARTPKKAPPADPRWAKDSFWFRAKPGEPVHQKVVAYGDALRELYSSAHNRDRAHEKLYEGVELKRSQAALQVLQQRGFSAARLNASKSIVNTVAARLSKQRATPSIIVDDADWSLKRKAKKYRKFVLGEQMSTDFDQRSVEALLDGGVLGNGITRIDDSGDGEKVIAERVLRNELLFDPRECLYGKPANAFRVQRIARDHLAELYPAHAGEIFNASPSAYRPTEELDDDTTRNQDFDDYVDVFSAWHPPRLTDGSDGRWVVCIDTATLRSEQWLEPRFPFAIYRFQKPRRGMWGRGLIYELKDLQHRVNCIVRDIQMNLTAVGRGMWMQRKGDEIPASLLTGLAPFTASWTGTQPPQWTAPTPFNQAQMNALQYLLSQMYELSGVSQAAAASKPSLGAGASGVAIDTQYDIESERFAMEERQYADYRLEAAQLYIDASKRVARKRKEREGAPKYFSGWQRGDAIERIEHDAVSLETDQYKLQIEAVNFIPNTRGGKLSAVGQLLQAGIYPQWLAAALFDEPDLARANKITLGAFFNCERKMEELADEDLERPMPMPHNDLELELKMSEAYLNNAEAEKAPPEVVERYLAYLDDVKELIKKKNAGAQAAAPAATPAMPPGVVPSDPTGNDAMVAAMSGGTLPPDMMPPMAA
jgi:hypothetical protein